MANIGWIIKSTAISENWYYWTTFYSERHDAFNSTSATSYKTAEEAKDALHKLLQTGKYQKYLYEIVYPPFVYEIIPAYPNELAIEIEPSL